MTLIPLAEAELHRFPVQTQKVCLTLDGWMTFWQPSSFSVLSLQLYWCDLEPEKKLYLLISNKRQN